MNADAIAKTFYVMDIMDQAVVTAPFTHKSNDRCENQLLEPEDFDISTALIRQQASLNFPNKLHGVRTNFKIQPITTLESSEEEDLPANSCHNRFITRTPNCYYKINKNGDTSERILSTLDPQRKNAENVCTFSQEHIAKASSTNASYSIVGLNILGIIQISNTRCQECSVAGARLEEKQSVHVPRRSSTEYDGHDDITYSNRTTNLYRYEQGVVVTTNSNESFNSRQSEEQIRVAFMKYFNHVGKVGMSVLALFGFFSPNLFWANAVKMIHMLLLVMRLLTMVVYLGYDVKCAMTESTTFANCSQEFLVSNPKNWVIYSKTFSIISSLTLLFIIWYNREELKYRFKRSFKSLYWNGSFWLTNFLFGFIFVYYIIRIDGSDLKLSIPLLIWWPATLVVVYCLNYLRPVNLPDLWFSLGYWFTIFTYVVETFCVFMAVTLASCRSIIPLITRDVDYKVKAFAHLVVLFRPCLASRFLYFFWYKAFNGGKDFFGSQS